MTSKIITISGEGSELIERLRAGMESRELIDLFGLKFAGVKLEIYTHGDPHAVMLADEVTEAQPAPWSGDGLPPVGARCEVLNTDLSNAEWEQCTILFSGKHRIVYDLESCSEFVGYRDCLQFRLIKTHAQIAAEERDAAIEAMWKIYWQPDAPTAKEALGLLWDAGLRFPKGEDQ